MHGVAHGHEAALCRASSGYVCRLLHVGAVWNAISFPNAVAAQVAFLLNRTFRQDDFLSAHLSLLPALLLVTKLLSAQALPDMPHQTLRTFVDFADVADVRHVTGVTDVTEGTVGTDGTDDPSAPHLRKQNHAQRKIYLTRVPTDWQAIKMLVASIGVSNSVWAMLTASQDADADGFGALIPNRHRRSTAFGSSMLARINLMPRRSVDISARQSADMSGDHS